MSTAHGSPAALVALRDELLELGGVLPEIREAVSDQPPAGVGLVSPSGGHPAPARLACGGPRTASAPAGYELLLEMIREGYLLHYGRSRLLEGADPDLALLVGDGLYALGLARLAQLGDVEAVTELGDLISLVAQAHVRADPNLAEAIWTAAAVAIGWGTDENLLRAKESARLEAPDAAAALYRAADSRRANTRPGDPPLPEGDNL